MDFPKNHTIKSSIILRQDFLRALFRSLAYNVLPLGEVAITEKQIINFKQKLMRNENMIEQENKQSCQTAVTSSAVFNGDCLEMMKYIPDGTIDMILCDLPYGTTACKWDVILPFELLWKQYKRVVKETGAIILFGSEPFSSKLRMSNLENYKYDWVWDKKMVTGVALVKKQPMKNHENIIVFYQKQCTYNFQKRIVTQPFGKITDGISENYGELKNKGNRGVGYPKTIIEFAKPNNLSKKDLGGLHPTQKPVALFEYLIKTYTNEGETVLDNCAGSGTTGIACINTNRNYILMEKEKKYFDIINERIDKHNKRHDGELSFENVS